MWGSGNSSSPCKGGGRFTPTHYSCLDLDFLCGHASRLDSHGFGGRRSLL